MIKLIQKNYTADINDFYIGVDSTSAVTITLPTVGDGKQYVVKAEMKPPLLNRKITIVTEDGSKIDGCSSYVLQVSYQAVWLLKRGEGWHITSSFN